MDASTLDSLDAVPEARTVRPRAPQGLVHGRAPASATIEFANLAHANQPLPVYESGAVDLDAEDPVAQITVPRQERLAAQVRLWGRDFLQFWASSLPHVTGRAPWVLGLRGALAFLIPLLIGLITGEYVRYLQYAVCAGSLAMADPGGSFDRRALTLLFTGLSCAGLFALGRLAGFSPVVTTLFIAAVVFLVGFTPEFANPGIRGGFLIASVALIGTSQHQTMTGLFDAMGFLYTTPLVILLSANLRRDSTSYEAIYQSLEESWRLRVFGRHLSQHLLCRTAVSRHALRMAVSAFMAVNFSELLGLGHPEWAAIASVILLHPTAPTFRSRAGALFMGTILGCGVAAAILMLTNSPLVAVVLVCLSLVFATPFRHVDYAAYVTMYSVFFIGAVSLVSGDLASELSLVRVADTLVGAACSLLVLRFSMSEDERRHLMDEIEYASRPRGEYAPLAVFVDDATCALADGGRCAYAEMGGCALQGSEVCGLRPRDGEGRAMPVVVEPLRA